MPRRMYEHKQTLSEIRRRISHSVAPVLTDTHAHRQLDRNTRIPTDTHAHRQTRMHTDRHTCTPTRMHTETHAYRQTPMCTDPKRALAGLTVWLSAMDGEERGMRLEEQRRRPFDNAFQPRHLTIPVDCIFFSFEVQFNSRNVLGEFPT